MPKLQVVDPVIFRVAIPVPVYRLFDYLAPADLDLKAIKPGVRLEVPFGKSKKIAYLLEITQQSDIDVTKLKPIIRVLDQQSLLSSKDLRLLQWASDYYQHPLGEVISTAFPTALRQGKPAELKVEKHYCLTELGKAIDSTDLKRTPKQKNLIDKFRVSEQPSLSETELAEWNSHWRPSLNLLITKQLLMPCEVNTPYVASKTVLRNQPLICNPQQKTAIDSVCGQLGSFKAYLLEGITGSGKTEVYLQIIQAVLEQGLQVLVLVPEITLTPQLEERFKQRFAVNIAISHSKLTDKQRQIAWLQMQTGQCSIMLGTRSALFTPLKRPGLIILDEEHDGSFKQQEGFRFSARDVALVRAKSLAIPVVLGSATPSLESLHNAQRQRYELLHLPERAGNSIEPELQLLDIRNKGIQEGLSDALIAEMHKTLAKNEQVLLFLNRRGFAPTLICHSCGWVARCLRCDANLVIHYDEARLRCHHCAQEQVLLKQCPDCKGGQLTPLGLGTERVERVLADLFADKVTVRLDRDTTQRKGTLEKYLQQINAGAVDIILGTQMLAKGHHFPNVTLVAILDVDSGLFSIDFHAAEKMAQMIVQVAGRAGRADKLGKVIMQTRHPEHPLLTKLITEGYNSFAQTVLVERKDAALPPYSYQALLRVQSLEPEAPKLFFQALSSLMQNINSGHTLILGPVAAPMAKRAGQYRYQLLFQNTRRNELQGFLKTLMPEITKLKQAKKVRWSLDVDPVDLY